MKSDQKVVLVTGGSSGIGKAIAEHLVEVGYIVYGTSRSDQKSSSSKVKMLKMDVTKENSVREAIEKIQLSEGKIDVLINNAGLGMAGPLEFTSDDDAREIFSTNVFGVMNVCRHTIPLLRQTNGGNIINITSIGGHFGLPYRGVYCSSKFAVEGYSESLSMELRQFGISVSIIEPGDFKTNINANRKIARNVDESLYPQFQQALNQVNNEVHSAGDPILIGKKIHQILNKKSPNLYYQVGTTQQKFSVFLKRILPGRIFEAIIMRHYGMNKCKKRK